MSAREDLRERLLQASMAGNGLPVTQTLALSAWCEGGLLVTRTELALTPRDLMKAAEQMALDALRITELEGELAAADALAEARAPRT